MTQLYVGNLSTDADDKVLRAVFGKYGPIRETIMKNGYAFIEYESSVHAETATKELNGTEILGAHLIVEPSHQQRITKQTWNSEFGSSDRRKILSSRVEVTEIPMCLTWESVETQLASVGNIIRSEHDIDDYGNLTGYVMYESVEQAQCAEAAFKGEENMFKTITINGSPECCTEACHMIMKIMQAELLSQTGYTSNLPSSLDRLPSVPLKILSHNDLIGRVIGKGGNTLKRIMQESGTKITISKLKELTPQKPERTITIMGTVDNCKKAESLISAKLRASYENDMAHLIPQQQQALTPVKYPQQTTSSSLFSGLSISTDQADHFVPNSTVNSMIPQNFPGSTTYQVPGIGGTTSTATLELSGLSGFTPPSNPQDTTLAASQLSNSSPPSKVTSTEGRLLSPTLAVPHELAINLTDEPLSNEVDKMAQSFGHLGMGNRPEVPRAQGKPRRSSVPGTLPPQSGWMSSQSVHTVTTEEEISSPIGSSNHMFSFLEDHPPREAWQPPPPADMDHHFLKHDEEDLLASTFYDPMQSQNLMFPQAFFQPSSAPPYVEPNINPYGGGGGTVMTSKLIGSPIKVKPDESMVGSPLYGWGSPPPQNVGSARTNLTFSFDFPHYSRSSQIPNNGVNTSNAFNLIT